MKIHKVNDVDCADIAEECIEALDELDDEKVAALLATAIQASNEKTLRHMAFKAAVLAAFSIVCVGMFLLYALGTDAPWRMLSVGYLVVALICATSAHAMREEIRARADRSAIATTMLYERYRKRDD